MPSKGTSHRHFLLPPLCESPPASLGGCYEGDTDKAAACVRTSRAHAGAHALMLRPSCARDRTRRATEHERAGHAAMAAARSIMVLDGAGCSTAAQPALAWLLELFLALLPLIGVRFDLDRLCARAAGVGAEPAGAARGERAHQIGRSAG